MARAWKMMWWGILQGTTRGCWWFSFRLIETLTLELMKHRLNKTLRLCSRLENWNGEQMKKSLLPSLEHEVYLTWEEVSEKNAYDTGTLINFETKEPVCQNTWCITGFYWMNLVCFFLPLVTLGNRISLFAAIVGFTKLETLILLFAVRVMREVGHWIVTHSHISPSCRWYFRAPLWIFIGSSSGW